MPQRSLAISIVKASRLFEYSVRSIHPLLHELGIGWAVFKNVAR